MSLLLSRLRPLVLAGLWITLMAGAAAAQASVEPGPDRRPGEGEGPFQRLILRGGTLIDGTGAPPMGPVDIVIQGNRIQEIRPVGYPKVPIRPEGRPQAADREVDVSGMYILPGFVDLHAHIGGVPQGTPAEYVYKLWMGHGVTTVRDPGSMNGIEWTVRERERSARNQIVAPRIFVYTFPPDPALAAACSGCDIDDAMTRPLLTPEDARAFVRAAKARGADGFKLLSLPPRIMTALIDEAKKQGMGTQAHLAQTGVARMDALDAARLGLGSLEHWYGLPEALFADRAVQDYPLDYNYSDESHRFAQAGRLWKQAAPQGSGTWNRVMDEFLELGFTFDPTLTIYEATRDAMRARRAEWHEVYTLPSLWEFYQPSREAHGSFWFDWTTEDEVAWKENYRIWMSWLNEYKNRGGRVCTGSDSGFIYKLYGFDYVRELELLREAGFHPLEVIRAATLCGAEVLSGPTGEEPEFGIVAPGMLADLVVVEENPLRNLKVLYGTGHLKLNDETGAVERVGGVKYTVKDGIVYDAKQLLRDVERMVAEAKRTRPFTTGIQ